MGFYCVNYGLVFWDESVPYFVICNILNGDVADPANPFSLLQGPARNFTGSRWLWAQGFRVSDIWDVA